MEFIGLLIFVFVVFVFCGPYIYTRVVESRRKRDLEEIKDSLASVNTRFDQLQKQLRELEKRTSGAADPIPAAVPGKVEPSPEAAKVPAPAIPPHPVVPPVAPPPRVEVQPVVPAAPPVVPQPVAPTVAAPAPPRPVVPPVAPPPRVEVRPVVPAAPPVASQPVAPTAATPAPPPAPPQPISSARTSLYCNHCGKSIQDGVARCPHCGERTTYAAARKDVASPEKPLAPPASAHVKTVPPVASYRPPPIKTVPPAPAVPSKKFSAAFEEMIGTNWLPKLGVTIMFIGLVSWIASQWEMIPPAGRIALFYLLGAGMLSLGIWFEKQERHLVLGRALIGGGWAVTFFTTYAMHHVAAAKILASIELDLLLMIAVAAAMVWHTLKYESQAVTGLAFLLGFFSVTQSHESVYSLLAGVILAVGLTVIVLRRKWYELEIFGILATFLNHFYWLYRIISPMQRLQGHTVPFAEFTISIAVLLAYWTIFRTSYVIRKIDNDYQEKVSTIAGLLNSFLLLGVLKYQSLHKELAFFALLTLGAIELTLAHLPVLTKRRTAFLTLSTLGGCLLIGAVPFRYADQPTSMSVLWLIFAQAFFFSGIFGKEVLYRRFGIFTGMLVGAYEIYVQGVPFMEPLLNGGIRHRDPQLGLLFAVTALLFYVNAHCCQRQWADLFEEDLDRTALSALSYFGGISVFLATYMIVPQSWVAVALAVVACSLAFAAKQFNIREALAQSHLFTAVAVIDVIVSNGELPSPVRIISFALVASLIYLSSRFVRLAEVANETQEFVGAVYTWLASFLIALLAWYQCRDSRTAIFWVAFALVLAMIARRWKLRHFWYQAHTLIAVSIGAILYFNMTDTAMHHGLTGRLISVVSISGMLYLVSRFVQVPEFLGEKGAEGGRSALLVSQSYTWITSSILALLAFYEAPDWKTAVAWSAFALVLSIVGKQINRNELNWQSFALGALAFVWTIAVNLDNSQRFHNISVRLLSTAFVAGALYLLTRWSPHEKVRPAYSWGASILLTALIYREFAEKSWIAPSLMLLALTLTAAARYWKRRELLWQSHALALLAFFQVLALNFNESYRFTYVQLISVAAVIAMFYAIYKLGDIDGLIESARIPQLYCWAGSLLVTWLMWYQLPSISVAIAWAIFGVLMFELGINDESSSFRMQGYVALAASFVLIFFANLNHPGRPGEISPRVYTVLPLALVYFYIYWRVNSKSKEELGRDARLRVQTVLAYLGTITIAALIRFEAPSDWVIAGYAALVFGLLLVALRTRQSLFLHQALLLLIPISFRAAMANFYNSPDGRILIVGTTALILFCCLPLAFALRNRTKGWKLAASDNVFDLLTGRPEQLLFFVPVALVTVLLFMDMPKGMLTLSWGAEGIVIFALALLAGERSFRLTGLALLMLCVAKILLLDVWNMNEPRNRYLTLIGMGAILLLVSFLYGKYREKVRELL